MQNYEKLCFWKVSWTVEVISLISYAPRCGPPVRGRVLRHVLTAKRGTKGARSGHKKGQNILENMKTDNFKKLSKKWSEMI